MNYVSRVFILVLGLSGLVVAVNCSTSPEKEDRTPAQFSADGFYGGQPAYGGAGGTPVSEDPSKYNRLTGGLINIRFGEVAFVSTRNGRFKRVNAFYYPSYPSYPFNMRNRPDPISYRYTRFYYPHYRGTRLLANTGLERSQSGKGASGNKKLEARAGAACRFLAQGDALRFVETENYVVQPPELNELVDALESGTPSADANNYRYGNYQPTTIKVLDCGPVNPNIEEN